MKTGSAPRFDTAREALPEVQRRSHAHRGFDESGTWKAFLGSRHPSHAWLLQPLRRPESEHDQPVASDFVLHGVVDTVDVDAAHTCQARVEDSLTNAGLKHPELQHALRIVANGRGCRKAVLTPPRIGTFNAVPLRAQ